MLLTDWPTIVDLLVVSGLADSKGAARRTVREGGVSVNKLAGAAPARTRRFDFSRCWSYLSLAPQRNGRSSQRDGRDGAEMLGRAAGSSARTTGKL